MTVKLFVAYTGKKSLEKVSFSVRAPACFETPRSFGIADIKGSNGNGSSSTPLVHEMTFRVLKRFVPSSLQVEVVAAFSTSRNEPRTATVAFRLPLSLVGRVVAPQKHCQYMFTLDSNRASAPPLTTLFADVLEPALQENAELERAANIMTLLFHGSRVDVTALVSSKSGRCRLQSRCFEALSLLSEELVHRLKNYFEQQDAKDKDSDKDKSSASASASASSSASSSSSSASASSHLPFKMQFSELLPLLDYFSLIDKHFAQRKRVEALRDELAQAALQFRVIQKRMLARFKDKNPTPLNQFDKILQKAYDYLQDTAQDMQTAQDTLSVIANQLSCATRLMNLLISFKYELDEENAAVLRHSLSPIVYDNLEMGWEEITDTALTYLLRTTLTKNVRENAVVKPLAPATDTAALRKHIQLVCERLGKGYRLCRDPPVLKRAAERSRKKKGGKDKDKEGDKKGKDKEKEELSDDDHEL